MTKHSLKSATNSLMNEISWNLTINISDYVGDVVPISL